ncbi:uncharacterized protein LOC127785837 [Oryza glaberrima]|uniref:uncharacterized protein LOC127785837 n=1 Tax=Oryza glaberrima TaxID=4538 RepID=UPI00023DC886|nr:uncharacterized protein LOC127785837 [Oryza glaberrima]
MATEAAPLPHLLPSFGSPAPTPTTPRHHLAELRIERAHSAVAFSAPCDAGKKRRCLLPPSSPGKKVLLELHPFGSPTPTPSPATAPPLLSSRAGTRGSCPDSDFSFPLAVGGTGGGGGGGGGGNMFAFLEDAPRAPTTPTGSSGSSALSFLVSPAAPETPTGSTASGGFAFVASPKEPTAPPGAFSFFASPKQAAATTGPTANGGFTFLGAPEQPLTPTGSNASGGCGSLSPKELHGGSAIAPLPSPTPASTDSTGSGGFSFFPSPGPAFGTAASPGLAAANQSSPTGGTSPSPPFVFTAWPAHKSGGRSSSNRRSRRNLRVATPRRGTPRPRDEQQPATPRPRKAAKTAAGEASRSSILSGSAGTPCCAFYASPAKAAKQESKNSSSEASRSGATSPEKTITPEREVEVSSAEREAPRPSSPAAAAACTVGELVVRVTCKCGVHKEFSFDHSH